MSRLNLAGSDGVRIEKAQRRFTGHSVGHWRGRFLLREVLRNPEFQLIGACGGIPATGGV